MHAFKFLSGFQVVLVALTIALQAAAVVPQVWHDFVLYAKYSAPAYGLICPQPLGKTLVRKIDNLRTGANAYIVRDDQRCEVVIAFRGTSLITDALTDLDIAMVPFKSPGVNAPGAKVNRPPAYIALVIKPLSPGIHWAAPLLPSPQRPSTQSSSYSGQTIYVW
ncbi:putative feruloyl esterase A [Leucoagaricus sp. SymC.cos]|nr:putative feruloyl esterase A [Leucoagaricus sp. SymC.cos]